MVTTIVLSVIPPLMNLLHIAGESMLNIARVSVLNQLDSTISNITNSILLIIETSC